MRNEYQKVYQGKRYWEWKIWAVGELGSKCSRCPRDNKLQVFNPLGKVKRYTRDLEGYVLLCGDCFREETRRRLKQHDHSRAIQHGAYAYRYLKCRCSVCRAANRR